MHRSSRGAQPRYPCAALKNAGKIATVFFCCAFLLVGLGVVFLCWLGTFVLQIFLSKADNPWLGLILPGITFGLILYICTWAPDFDTIWYGLSRGNIPTVIYLLTYFFVRKRKKKR